MKKDGQSTAKKSTPPTRSQGGPTLICDPRGCTRVTRRQAVVNSPNREDGTAPSSEWGECSRFRTTTRTGCLRAVSQLASSCSSSNLIVIVNLPLGSSHTIFQSLPRRGSVVRECLRKRDRSVEKSHRGLHQPKGDRVVKCQTSQKYSYIFADCSHYHYSN